MTNLKSRLRAAEGVDVYISRKISISFTGQPGESCGSLKVRTEPLIRELAQQWAEENGLTLNCPDLCFGGGLENIPAKEGQPERLARWSVSFNTINEATTLQALEAQDE